MVLVDIHCWIKQHAYIMSGLLSNCSRWGRAGAEKIQSTADNVRLKSQENHHSATLCQCHSTNTKIA